MRQIDTSAASLGDERYRRSAAMRASARVLDVVVATLALIFLAPLFGLIALAILASRDGPVMFAHPRLGRGGRIIKVLKFRSMRTDAAAILEQHLDAHPAAAEEWARDQKLRNDPRVTRLGRFLRLSSLDELPQLLNVVRGDMSLVGPRPIVVAEAARYGRFLRVYCSLRPGITGVWQVSGRSDVSYRRRVAMDVIYARNKCVLLDVQLMLATVPAVLARRGAY